MINIRLPAFHSGAAIGYGARAPANQLADMSAFFRARSSGSLSAVSHGGGTDSLAPTVGAALSSSGRYTPTPDHSGAATVLKLESSGSSRPTDDRTWKKSLAYWRASTPPRTLRYIGGICPCSSLASIFIASGESRRGASFASNSARLRSASAARALASATPIIAAASFSFDRPRSSVWCRPSILPNSTSPIMPNAIKASATAGPHLFHAELYGGCSPAMTSSANTATTTIAAHPHSHRSHDDDAFSTALSVAFIVPRRRYHAGNEFRGFWVGLLVGALLFAIFVAVGLYLQWPL